MKAKATRRTFLKLTAAGLGGLAVGTSAIGSVGALASRLPRVPRNVLVLGGTGWLGPRIVEALIRRGHTVTLFNRGETNPHLFPDVEKLRGNRYPYLEPGLEALRGRQWDAAIDVWARHPSLVRAAVAMLHESVGHYLFVSSIAVYADFKDPGITEDYPVREPKVEPLEEDGNWSTYGARKAICEQVANSAFPGRTTIARAHAIYQGLLPKPLSGLPYWLGRLRRGGEVLAPGTGRDPVQYIDARDISAWLVHAIETSCFGTYNTHIPASQQTLARYIDTYRSVLQSEAKVTWVSEEFLREQEVRPFSEMPQWVPVSRGAFYQISSERAIETGLTFRPLEQTARDMLASFDAEFGSDHPFGPNFTSDGISADREARVLEAWRAGFDSSSRPRRRHAPVSSS